MDIAQTLTDSRPVCLSKGCNFPLILLMRHTVTLLFKTHADVLTAKNAGSGPQNMIRIAV